ncbi:MAG: hypothetical protein ACK47B_23030 [Armatimonadota bacterium]
MMITFSGVDGAGKSTLIEALKSALEAQNQRVTVFHMNEDIGLYASIRALRDRAKRLSRAFRPRGSASSNERTPERRSTAPRPIGRNVVSKVVWNKSLRRWVDLLDLLVFYYHRYSIERVQKRVLIMDRYFYDRLVDLADGHRWTYARWFLKVVPTPDVPVFVDADPRDAFARKGEFDLDNLRRRQAAYRCVFGWVDRAVILTNEDLKASISQLQELVVERRAG